MFLGLLFLALPAFAQQNEAAKPVATVNGQTITAEQLNAVYEGLSPQMREQYDKAGGKRALLDNFVNQTLITQQAKKTGFDHRPDIAAEIDNVRESALFQAYVRDIIASGVVSDADVRAYYDQNKGQFAIPERAHVRHIFIAASDKPPHQRTKDEALAMIQKIVTELREAGVDTINMTDKLAAQRVRINQFAQFAKKYSEDAAESGGDLGWVTKQQLDPDFAAAAWGIPIGTPSGIMQTKYGYHVILVEERQPAGVQSFDDVKTAIRDALLGGKMNDVMTLISRVTNELRSKASVMEFPENIK